ncbi:hypothetical protein Despr_1021 [Desulfobulbus propionicus DSM 2032]|jgi:hypothetical protein|uniref:Uncharacterized protein n=1 Tax=Desulfobulbus propionicus (strain ATCC 33891 / DSM 2032 / VKM B-1956 / 1pr3) TaxID=577650 RepID=A0A7U3YKQ9_DESPD|nr:hypothetical protein [Desulfobulbus propionicus]ADW17193.1 hypothetical protein Despr_1021 [Desulfobulbus propionicus DSM 2032]
MILSLTCALITAAVLSMFFRSTQGIGIICITVLAFLYPIPVMVLATIGIAVYFYWKFL